MLGIGPLDMSCVTGKDTEDELEILKKSRENDWVCKMCPPVNISKSLIVFSSGEVEDWPEQSLCLPTQAKRIG